MKFYQRWIGDYQKDTQRLSILEHGAYCLLLDEYYSTEQSLPLEPMQLHRICTAIALEEQEAIASVLQYFFIHTENGWIHERAEKEIEKGRAKSKSRSDAAHIRWGTNGKRTRQQRMALARDKGTHTDNEWQALLSVFNHKCAKCGPDSRDQDLTKDHVVPLSRSGDDSIKNIQPLCLSCNSGRSGEIEDYRPSFMQLQSVSIAGAGSNAIHEPQPQPQLKKKNKELFPSFWDAFGHKHGKADALKVWNKIDLTDELFEAIIKAAKAEALKRPALMEKGGSPKWAQGWLTSKRWEDEGSTEVSHGTGKSGKSVSSARPRGAAGLREKYNIDR